MSTSMSSRFIPRSLAKSLLAGLGMFLLLGGCAWSPFGPDKDKADAGTADAAPELEHCTLKASACNNSCLDRGSKCRECCQRNAISCDEGGSYRFSACPDEE